MKSLIQDLLKRAGLYHRIKTSFVYELYWQLADPQLLSRRDAEIEFYKAFLHPPAGAVIFDIGANYGEKTSLFLRLGCRVIAVEPDSYCQGVLHQKFRRWRVRPMPVTVLAKAVSDRASTKVLFVDHAGSAKNTLSVKWTETLRSDDQRFGTKLSYATKESVKTTTLDEMISCYGRPHFVKIDVEGHEPEVLNGLTQSVPFLSFEVNLPEFLPEGLECVRRLQEIHSRGLFNYATGDCTRFSIPEWLPLDLFSEALRRCPHSSVEVFWKTPA